MIEIDDTLRILKFILDYIESNLEISTLFLSEEEKSKN